LAWVRVVPADLHGKTATNRLAELREIAMLLSDSLTPRGVGQWLHAKNRLLGGHRAIDLLADGNVDEVRLAARAFIEGA
jgi:IS5 family transposase